MVKQNNTRTLRIANRYIVLMAILEQEALTIEEIIRRTILSRPTVLEILKELMYEGLIIKSGKVPAAVGRQPTLYSINNQVYFAMGIDIDFPTIHLAVSNLSGNLIYTKSRELSYNTPASDIVLSLSEMIENSIDETGIRRQSVIGLGVGTPAIVNIKENLALRISKIPTWENIDIASYIQEKNGIQITVHNDAHMLGFIERKYHKLHNESFVYITHRSGVGSAIFINGEIYDGCFGNSGYLGHSCVDIRGEKCECGNTGCLELFCSRRAIVNQYNKLSKQIGGANCGNCDQVFERSNEGDLAAIDVLNEAGRILGIGVSNLLRAFDIYRVILGCVKTKNTPFYESFVSSINNNLRDFAVMPITVDLGRIETINSGLAGCYYVLSKFFQAPSLHLNY